MAKITRIKAGDGPSKKDEAAEPVITRKKVVVKDKKLDKNKRKEAKKAEKALKRAQSGKKPFILVRPFVYLWRYLRDSWQELRQVRWPNRKQTWKLTFAVIIYILIIALFLMVLDAILKLLFNNLIGGNM